MKEQSTSHIFMVYPTSFGFNTETAGSNHFQTDQPFDENKRKLAQKEFEAAVASLRANGINVTVFKDDGTIVKPDAVFPNNWISVHPEGYVLYPMEALNRRTERTPEIYGSIERELNISCLLDMSPHEDHNEFLEGTGSVIFDHVHKKAYAAISSRTNEALFLRLCKTINYKPVTFNTTDRDGNAVYHTNVLLAIGTGYAILCEEAIKTEEERERIRNEFKSDEMEIIPITMEQMYSFAGNMIELTSNDGFKKLVMSKSAHDSLTEHQLKRIKAYATPLVIDVNTIETFGGGSIRCMIAELFF